MCKLSGFEAVQMVEFFTFSDELRASGVTNMFGAAPYVEEEFGLERKEADVVLNEWMRTFSREKAAAERAKEWLASRGAKL
jgi:hypothetical protein